MGQLPKVLLAFFAVGILGLVASVGTHAKFSGTTANATDSFQAGTLYLTDNDSGSAMLSLSSAMPGASDTSCIEVRSAGSLDSTVHLYGTVSGALASHLTLTVTRGSATSSSFDTCSPASAFTGDGTNYNGNGAGVVYSGALSSFPSTYATGIVDPSNCGTPPCSAETWTTNEPHLYKFVITLPSNVSSSAESQSATATFTWEGRNL